MRVLPPGGSRCTVLVAGVRTGDELSAEKLGEHLWVSLILHQRLSESSRFSHTERIHNADNPPDQQGLLAQMQHPRKALDNTSHLLSCAASRNFRQHSNPNLLSCRCIRCVEPQAGSSRRTSTRAFSSARLAACIASWAFRTRGKAEKRLRSACSSGYWPRATCGAAGPCQRPPQFEGHGSCRPKQVPRT